MNLMNMIISAVIKKGILYEARNCDVECDIPMIGQDGVASDAKIKVNLKIEHMTLKFDKGEA